MRLKSVLTSPGGPAAHTDGRSTELKENTGSSERTVQAAYPATSAAIITPGSVTGGAPGESMKTTAHRAPSPR